ncbi:CO dehydrogenase accessory protein CooC (nickel insertion) [Dissulfuribacter thermophilus]|uniref:CO dehydrogenase accessory protein CooC (Nickel insertion) n=1 Tax=Dissulfuribacter thermophilus TaxID=1156395 RepID=A0A1B9F8G0_9BACT|nr:AAA family ATPase [Dissulfuribacter thermophilus]OCC16217.1 CO dehydrogenase accessory protein CooC (nickel insertion) [Dissulfuribacter thermophilus]
MTNIPNKALCLAMAGKGGTGKTTLSALLVKYLVSRKLTPVLAVDADANANLNELLGVEVETTLGEIRDRMKTETPPGMTKNEYMEMHINQAIIEETGFDLIVMGQPEGPGCYCMANSILAQVIEKLMKSYRYLIVDNEAGMEHLSRLNLRDIETLFVVSDASSRGVLTATRIASLTSSLGVEVGKKVLIVNKAPKEVPEALDKQVREATEKTDLVFGGYISQSETVFTYEVEQRPLLELEESSDVVKTAFQIFDRFVPVKN